MDAQNLASFELFNGLDADELHSCGELFTEQRVLMGDQLTQEDDFGYSFFIVLDGRVAVKVDGQEVAQLGPGDHFGEVALVRGERRNATVSALESGRVAKMMTWDFNELMQNHPTLASRIEARAAERDNR